MPSLQELLAAKRKEKENASTKPQVNAEPKVVEKPADVQANSATPANPLTGLAAALASKKRADSPAQVDSSGNATALPAFAQSSKVIRQEQSVNDGNESRAVNAEAYKHSTQLDAVQEQELASLQGAISLLREHMDVPDLVGDSIRNVMTLIQARPYLKDLLRPEDMGALVRGLRESYGVVIQKKQENKGKRAKSAQKVDQFEKLLMESGGDFGSLKF